MSNTQETATIYVDNVAFEVDYQFDDSYLPSNKDSGFNIVGIAGTDEETGECEDFTPFLKYGKDTVFYRDILQETLTIADSEWRKATDEVLAENKCDNSRW